MKENFFKKLFETKKQEPENDQKEPEEALSVHENLNNFTEKLENDDEDHIIEKETNPENK